MWPLYRARKSFHPHATSETARSAVHARSEPERGAAAPRLRRGERGTTEHESQGISSSGRGGVYQVAGERDSFSSREDEPGARTTARCSRRGMENNDRRSSDRDRGSGRSSDGSIKPRRSILFTPGRLCFRRKRS